MAKICAHGKELGRVKYLTEVRAYFADGAVLTHQGFGWKLAGRVKKGIDPVAHFANVVESRKRKDEERPALALYREVVYSFGGLAKSWKIRAAVGTMPEDPDGVYVELVDDYSNPVDVDLDDVVRLCKLYRAAQEEGRRLKEAQH